MLGGLAGLLTRKRRIDDLAGRLYIGVRNRVPRGFDPEAARELHELSDAIAEANVAYAGSLALDVGALCVQVAQCITEAMPPGNHPVSAEVMRKVKLACLSL